MPARTHPSSNVVVQPRNVFLRRTAPGHVIGRVRHVRYDRLISVKALWDVEALLVDCSKCVDGKPGNKVTGNSDNGLPTVGSGEGERVVGRGDRDAVQKFAVREAVIRHEVNSRQLADGRRLKVLALSLRAKRRSLRCRSLRPGVLSQERVVLLQRLVLLGTRLVDMGPLLLAGLLLCAESLLLVSWLMLPAATGLITIEPLACLLLGLDGTRAG